MGERPNVAAFCVIDKNLKESIYFSYNILIGRDRFKFCVNSKN